MKSDRSKKPRGKPAAANRGGQRRPERALNEGAARRPARFDENAPRRPPPGRPPRERGDATDPYQPARRPARDFGGDRFAQRRESGARGGFGERGGRGFTVTLDPDVARVFRGDASVNRALRLVLQLMQVVQGPPAPRRDRAPRGYQGSPEARGFTRRPRFEDNDETDDGVE